MTEQKQTEQEKQANLYTEVSGLTDAIQHIRNAKGVLDTFPETRKYVKTAEDAAEVLEKKLEPLRKRLDRATGRTATTR